MTIYFGRRARLIAAFASVYLIWGSTYLAIRWVVQGMPPALSAGMRFIAAALILLIFGRVRGMKLPLDAASWRSAGITGFLMLVLGNGLVTWSEQWIESNQAALIVATAALWIAWFGTWGGQGQAVSLPTLFGLLVGFVGVALLVGGGIGGHQAPPLAYAALLASALAWAAGSIYAMRHPTSGSPLMTATMQMLVAGVVLLLVGLAAGEREQLHWQKESALALLYLTIFGSCIAYGAYLYLVHEVTPAQLSTYAYINPAVAVLLGWWLADERLGPSQLAGTLVILAAVVLVNLPAQPRAAEQGA